jgi:hypothetical protein
MNGLQGSLPVGIKKDWKKPVLDIIELERAESGFNHHTGDGRFTHRSTG